jgi:hypothetical protein
MPLPVPLPLPLPSPFAAAPPAGGGEDGVGHQHQRRHRHELQLQHPSQNGHRHGEEEEDLPPQQQQQQQQQHWNRRPSSEEARGGGLSGAHLEGVISERRAELDALKNSRLGVDVLLKRAQATLGAVKERRPSAILEAPSFGSRGSVASVDYGGAEVLVNALSGAPPLHLPTPSVPSSSERRASSTVDMVEKLDEAESRVQVRLISMRLGCECAILTALPFPQELERKLYERDHELMALHANLEEVDDVTASADRRAVELCDDAQL